MVQIKALMGQALMEESMDNLIKDMECRLKLGTPMQDLQLILDPMDNSLEQAETVQPLRVLMDVPALPSLPKRNSKVPLHLVVWLMFLDVRDRRTVIKHLISKPNRASMTLLVLLAIPPRLLDPVLYQVKMLLDQALLSMPKAKALKHRVSNRIMADILLMANNRIMDLIMVIKAPPKATNLVATVHMLVLVEITMATTLAAIGVAATIIETVLLIGT